MSKRLLIVIVLMVAVLTAAGITAVAGQGSNVEINQKIVGSIFSGIEVTTGQGNSVTENRALLNLYAKGAPGSANIEAVGGAIPAAVASGLCPAGTNLELTFVDAGFVETFNDHSMLFYAIDNSPDADNALCVHFDGLPSTGVFDYVITGGTGRFEGAAGSATVEITSWSVTQELSAETGTIRGTVILP